MGEKIRGRNELKVYRNAFAVAMKIFHASKSFPPEEKFSLTDQIRKSSRSVCANIAEAWRKRRYPAAFVSKLSDAETEAEETGVWLEFARECGYIDKTLFKELSEPYEVVLPQLVNMIQNSNQWVI